MTELFEVLVALVVFLDMMALFYKGKIRKDWGIIGSLAPMVYLVGAIIYDLIIGNLGSDYFHIGIFLVLLGNLISNIFIITSKRFKLENYATHLVEILKDLKIKYDFVVEHAPIGIYVINKIGRFEFVNKALCTLSGYNCDELLTMQIRDILVEDNLGKAELTSAWKNLNTRPVADYNTQLKTKSGILKKVKVNAKNTTNGHATITGSITLLEE